MKPTINLYLTVNKWIRHSNNFKKPTTVISVFLFYTALALFTSCRSAKTRDAQTNNFL